MVRLGETRRPWSIGVIGAGVMGRGIALQNVLAGNRVQILDQDENVAARAVEEILQAWQAKPARVRSHHGADRPLISVARSDADLAGVQFVIETVPENIATKTAVLSRIEASLANQAIIVSNSSSISPTRLACCLKDSSRFCGLHFCHPVAERPLAEIVIASGTHPQTVQSVAAYARAIGMRPLLVADSPGFLVNRLLMAYLNSALELLADGTEIGAIDAAAVEFGFPTGPLTMLDEFGIDVALSVGTAMYWQYPDRIVPSALLIDMYKSGRLGRKVGNGFYYRDGQPHSGIVPGVIQMIRDRQRATGPIAPEVISRRLLLPMLIEGTRSIETGVVRSPELVDVAMRDGLGMTERYTGMFHWANTIGTATILEWLRDLSALGGAFTASTSLREAAAINQPLFAMQRHAA